MQYVGGVLSGAWKVTFTCCNSSRRWVSLQTRAVWESARREDPEATFFLSPLAADAGALPEFSSDDDEDRSGSYRR